MEGWQSVVWAATGRRMAMLVRRASWSTTVFHLLRADAIAFGGQCSLAVEAKALLSDCES